MVKKYTLPKVDVETVLKHMLLYHYDDYYNKGFLREVLSNLTEDELSVVYLKNNFKEFIKVPEVKEVIETIYKENNRERTDLSDKQKTLYNNITGIFKCKELSEEDKSKAGKHYMVAYAKDEVYGPLSKKLKQMSGELLMGFYFYSGDYVNGTYAETSVDIFETMDRVKIPTADTDSNVSTVFDENLLLNEEYSMYTKEDEYIEEVATTVLATIIFTGSIDASLSRYTQAVGVDEDYSHLIEMEEETTMYDLHLTTGKKKYVFSYFIQDGNFNPKVYESIKIKGLQSIKSDYNAEICDRVNAIFRNRVMVKLDKLSYKDVIMDAKFLTFDILKMVKTDDYIINKSTIKKSNKSSEELAFGDSKNKMARLWKRFGIPGDISFPGSFKELDVKFSNETINMIKDELPNDYIALVDHVKEIKLFEFYRNVINGFKKLLDDKTKISLEALTIQDNVLGEKLKKMSGPVSRLNADQLNETFARKLSADLFDSQSEKATTDLIRKALNLGPKDIILYDSVEDDVIIDVTNEDITDNIVKLGLPIDINVVPDFIKINDYDIIDTEFAATGEFLLGALTDTLGISCPRNTSDKMLISSALQSY